MTSNPNLYYKYLNFLFAGMLLSTLIFLGVSSFLIITSGKGIFIVEDHLIKLLEFVLLGSVLVIIPSAIILHRRSVLKIITRQQLLSKLKGYAVSLIIKLVLVELVCYLNLIILLISGKFYLIFSLILLILYMLQSRPSVERIAQELQLSPNEKEQITK
jgi:hypothetical protein